MFGLAVFSVSDGDEPMTVKDEHEIPDEHDAVPVAVK